MNKEFIYLQMDKLFVKFVLILFSSVLIHNVVDNFNGTLIMKNEIVNNKKKYVKKYGDERDYVKVIMIHAKWCRYCKKALPEWMKLINKVENHNIENYKIKYVDYEQTRDEDVVNKYNPDSFPSYVVEYVIHDGDTYTCKHINTFHGTTYDDILSGIRDSIMKS